MLHKTGQEVITKLLTSWVGTVTSFWNQAPVSILSKTACNVFIVLTVVFSCVDIELVLENIVPIPFGEFK